MGTATTIAIAVITNVATTSGSTPKLAGSNSGDQSVPNRKSAMPTSPRKEIVSPSSEKMIPSVVRTEIRAASMRRALIRSSPQRRRAARRLGASARPCAAVVDAASTQLPSAVLASSAWLWFIGTICEASEIAS